MTQTNKFDINKPYCITDLDVKNMLAYDKNWIDNEWDGKFDALYRAINDGDYKDIPYMLYTGTKEERHQLHKGLGMSFKHWSFDFAGYPNRIMVIVNNETNFSKYFMQPSCGNLPVLYFNKASAERIEDLRECYAIYHRAMNNVVPDTDDWAESVRDRVNQEFGYALPEEVEDMCDDDESTLVEKIQSVIQEFNVLGSGETVAQNVIERLQSIIAPLSDGSSEINLRQGIRRMNLFDDSVPVQ